MVLLHVDKTSAEPVYKQIIQGIIQHIEKGDLCIGERIPSSRQMAQALGLNRSTVYRAYEELISLGYLESSPGSYTRIRKRYILCLLRRI